MKNEQSTQREILFSRLLTQSGDQAWDFALPLALILIIPGRIDLIALYYLLVRFGKVLFLPKLGKFIDLKNRLSMVKIGIASQSAAVILSGKKRGSYDPLNSPRKPACGFPAQASSL